MPRPLLLATLGCLLAIALEAHAHSPGGRSPARCSASALSARLPAQPGLPAKVARMRQDIAQAAVSCDFARLQALALAGPSIFDSSAGGGAQNIGEMWQAEEQMGLPNAAWMVNVLKLPHGIRREEVARSLKDTAPPTLTVYVWPSAAVARPTEKDWRALRPLYRSEAQWKKDVAYYKRQGRYMGYRIGITEGGDWIYFWKTETS